MRHYFLFLLSFFSLVLAAWASPWGVVVDDRGRPVAGANVEFTPMYEFNHIIGVISDAGGNLFLPDAKNREKDDFVVARHPDYASHGVCHVKSKELGGTKPYEIVLSTGPGLQARVLSDNQKPISGAEAWYGVDLKGENEDCSHHYFRFERRLSDEKGVLHMPQMQRGKLTLMVTAKGWVSRSKMIIQHQNAETVHEVVLEKSKPVDLYFVNEKGEPAEGVKFTYAFSEKEVKKFKVFKDVQKFSKQTGQASNKTIFVPLNGFLHVKISSNPYFEVDVLNLDLQDLSSHTITVKRKIHFTGKVVDSATGAPISGARLLYRYKHPRSGASRTYAKTRIDGTFDNWVTAEKMYPDVYIQHGDYRPKDVLIEDSTEGLSYSLEKGDPFRFIILQAIPYSDPALVPGREVEITDPIPGFFPFNVKRTTDQRGVVEIGSLISGREMTLAIQGYASQKVTPTLETGSMEVVFQNAGTFTVLIVNEQGEPLRAFLSRTTGDRDYVSNDQNEKTKLMTISTLQPGEYELRVSKHDYIDQRLKVKVDQYKVHHYDVVLKQHAPLRVALDDFQGEAPKALQVRLKNSNSTTSMSMDLVKGSQPPTYSTTLSEARETYHQMEVSAEGYRPARVQLNWEVPADPWRITLQRGQSLAVRVVNTQGEALEGVDLRYRRERGDGISQTTKTNDEGCAELTGLEDLVYSVGVEAEGYLDLNVNVDVATTVGPMVWTLNRGGSLQVTVLNENQEPVEGLKLQLYQAMNWGGFQQVWGDEGKATTDVNGVATFGNLEEKSYIVKANHADFGIGETEAQKVSFGIKTPVQMILKKGLALRGRVVDLQGNPVAGVSVTAKLESPFGQTHEVETTSDASGDFTLSPLKMQTYHITATHADHDPLDLPAVDASNGLPLDLRLSPATFVSLIVKDPQGHFPEEVELRVSQKWLNHSKENHLRQLNREESGWKIKSNQLKGPNGEGTFTIKASCAGYNPGTSKTYEMNALPETITIELKPELKAVFIVLDDLGQPVSNVEVEVESIQSNRRQSLYLHDLQSDLKGRVTVAGLPAGEYAFTFKHDRFAPTVHSSRVETQPVDQEPTPIAMHHGAEVRGRILQRDGQPMAQASVWWTPSGRSTLGWNSSRELKSDAEGRYRLTGVGPGEVNLCFNRGERIWQVPPGQMKSLSVSNDEVVELDLQAEAVENAGDVQVEMPQGTYLNAMLMPMLNPTQQHQGIREGDRFVFHSVPEGEYLLMVMGVGGLTKRDVLVKANEITVVDLAQGVAQKIVAIVQNSKGHPLTMASAVLMPEGAEAMTDPTQAMSLLSSIGMVQSGALRMDVEKPGTYQLVIQEQGSGASGPSLIVHGVELIQGQTLDLGTLKMKAGGTLIGRVHQENGEPIEGAGFVTFQGLIPNPHQNATSKADGSFELDGVPQAPWTLVIHHPDYAPKTVDVTQLVFVDVTLEKGGTVNLQVVGEGKAGLHAELVNEENQASVASGFNRGFGQNTTNAEGAVCLKNVNPGRHRIVVMGTSLSEPVYSEVFEVSAGATTTVSVPL